MQKNVTVVPRPFAPQTVRKKGLRDPYETIAIARELAEQGATVEGEPSAVVHSVGHITENAARSAVKRIHKGNASAWREFKGLIHAYTVPYDDGTYGVAIQWLGGDDQ